VRAFPAKLRWTAAIGALLGACGAVPASAAVNDPPPVPRPDALQQPLTDGCQRNPAGLLTYTSPEWVYVYSHGEHGSQPTRPRVVEGVSRSTDVGAGDLPEGHNFYDLNTDVGVAGGLDGPFGYLLGGDPAARNGNFHSDNPILHVEWESGTPPPWSWPVAGDQLKLWGHWIWDCGHWSNGARFDPGDPSGSFTTDQDYFLPGSGQSPLGNEPIRGEETEFHPMTAMISARHNPYVPDVGESQTDAFISSQGTPANADSSCAHDHPAPAGADFYGPDWSVCVNNPASEHQTVNDREYTFFIPAPPKPTPNATVRFRSSDHNPAGQGPAELVAPTKSGVFVNIPFQGFGSPSEQLAFGKSLFVGWSGATQFVPAHIQVIFKKLTIHHSLDEPSGFDTSAGVPPGEWNMYSDINGQWKLINDYAPGLAAVNSGDTLELNHTYDLNVADGQPLRIHLDTRECDLPKIQPCPATSEVAEDNDNPGSADITFPSVADAVGDHVITPSHESDPTYELSYEVKLISPAGKKKIGPGKGCFDVFPPETHAIRRKTRVNRSTIRLRGAARERNCASKHAKPRGVEVSVARKAGKKCRFLGSAGKLGKREPCRLRRYLPAKGRRHWRFGKAWPGRPGTYEISTRARDRAGNIELPDKANTFRLRLGR
jgi:hypothetical protein